MPDSSPNSSDSLRPSVPSSAPESDAGGAAARALPPVAWRTNLWLFLATVVSVFVTGAGAKPWTRDGALEGAQFAGSLLAILVAHEFGHWIAARIHRVEASLPYFIPLPILSPFGTMGAVIRMRGRIPTRPALLDIGASGPLAGLVLAIPLYVWGAAHSHFVPLANGVDADSMELGESLLIKLLDRVAHGPAPAGMELQLSPVAFGAWAGMFVTMINLLPVGQLDGGHVAYSLFGPRQDRFAIVIHRAMLAFFAVGVVGALARDVHAGLGFSRVGTHVMSSLFWLVWFEVLAILGTLSSPANERARGRSSSSDDLESRGLPIHVRAIGVLGLAVLAAFGNEGSRGGPLLWVAWFAGLGVLLAMEARWGVLRKHALLDHPATGAAPLGKGRAAIAIVTLAMFALLFMPTPISM